MAFGIYIHIPYCIQRCTYCDFATYEQSSILPPANYIELVLNEIRTYAPLLKSKNVDTIYFGGGTPSLIEPQLLNKILKELMNQGFELNPQAEVTIEINPATINSEKLDSYLAMGINRFSVGAQTFKDSHLKFIGREHNTSDTLDTLQQLDRRNLNYSFDILFALPHQTIDDLRQDLEMVKRFNPKHVSPYCLTVPNSNPLAKNRISEEGQGEMFNIIRNFLLENGYLQYEISNFAKPGFESKHNLLYWLDHSYWGIGLSAHSYTQFSKWGERFWNFNSIQKYTEWASNLTSDRPKSILTYRPQENFEELAIHQSLTDFCHTSMRVMQGLSLQSAEAKFGSEIASKIENILKNMHKKGWVEQIATSGSEFNSTNWKLTESGILISNQVFAELTFLNEDIN